MNSYHLIRRQAFEANLRLPKLGLVQFTFGNVSVADQNLKVFAIKPSGVPYEILSEQDLVVVDFNGKVLEGRLRPSSDTNTHALLYKNWHDVNSIVHTHSTFATAWAQSRRDIPLYGTTHADHLTVPVPCAPPMSDDKIIADYEIETARQILDCLTERGYSYKKVNMILVANHAPFTWGKNAEEAVYASAILESIAQMAYLTEQIDNCVSPMKETLIDKHYKRKHGPSAYYGQL